MIELKALRPGRRLARGSVGRDAVLLSGSLVLQILLAMFLGNAYDMRIFMATGYLTAHGFNPYVPLDTSQVFGDVSFNGITSIGYPPPWTLMTGLLYLATYRLLPNLLLYNLALKLPIIAANVGLATLVRNILLDLGVSPERARGAWVFFLFNPFLLLTSAAWGQFDPLVALLAVASLYLLHRGKTIVPAALLALAVSLKPTPLPLLPIALVYLAGRSWRRTGGFLGVFSLAMVAFCAGPFALFGWSPSPILAHWNNQLTVGGALSFMTFLEYVQWSYTLPAAWWFLGWLWLPALLLALLTLKRGIGDLQDLLRKSAGFVLVFFLSRSWLSETNLNLFLPLAVILVAIGEFKPWMLTAAWVIPLVFAFFNTDLTQLLFPSLPSLMNRLLEASPQWLIARYTLRTLTVIAWLAVAGPLAWRCLRPAKPARLETA